MVHAAPQRLSDKPATGADPAEYAARRSTLRRVLPSGERVSPHLRHPRTTNPCIHFDTVCDPACGSGNFLTETYLSLRRLENRVIGMLAKDSQISLGFENVSPIKVPLGQFYGLEINDFAVSVATTALWIAKLQANIETQELVDQATDDFPLRGAANIHRGNALTKEWSEIINAGECDYIIGNPPFLGARNQSKEQKAELKAVFPRRTKNVGNIDYVAGWFIKAAQFVGDHKTRIGFVATNSVVQGEQVANIWFPIISLGFHIDFAHDTFRWVNESTDKAHVFCVIVGFSKQESQKVLYHYPAPNSPPEVQYKQRLNPYLVDAPDAFVWNRSTPICDVPRMGIGNKPIDGGNYLFTDDQFREFLSRYPEARQYSIRGLAPKNSFADITDGFCGQGICPLLS